MGISPAVTIGALVALMIIIAVTVIESPANAQQVSIQIAPIIAVLLAILRSDYLAIQAERKRTADAEDLKKQTEDKAAELKRQQDEKAEELKEAQRREAEKIRQTMAAANAVRDDTMQAMKGALDTVVKQTNGDLSKKLETIASDVKQGIEQSNGMKDELVKAVKDAAFNAGVKSETDKHSPGTEA